MNPQIHMRFQKNIPSSRDEVSRALTEAMEFYRGLQGAGIAMPVDEFYFRLAIDELLENALSHGNRHDESKRIGLAISVARDGIDIAVRDEGAGFRPDAIANPTRAHAMFRNSGRGLHLLRSIGDLTWNDLGNEIRIRVR